MRVLGVIIILLPYVTLELTAAVSAVCHGHIIGVLPAPSLYVSHHIMSGGITR